MARYLVDENLPWSLAQALTKAGFEATDVYTAGLSGRPDEEVFEYAKANGYHVVTRDQGFGNPMRFPLEGSPIGIVVARLPSKITNAQLAALIVSGVQQIIPEQLPGSVAVIEPARVRVRKKIKR